MSTTMPVTHDAVGHRFALATDDGPAVLRYEVRDGMLDLQHTNVPAPSEGQGFGTALARAALDYARSSGTKVIPSCPFVRAFLDDHPEYADVVARTP